MLRSSAATHALHVYIAIYSDQHMYCTFDRRLFSSPTVIQVAPLCGDACSLLPSQHDTVCLCQPVWHLQHLALKFLYTSLNLPRRCKALCIMTTTNFMQASPASSKAEAPQPSQAIPAAAASQAPQAQPQASAPVAAAAPTLVAAPLPAPVAAPSAAATPFAASAPVAESPHAPSAPAAPPMPPSPASQVDLSTRQHASCHCFAVL